VSAARPANLPLQSDFKYLINPPIMHVASGQERM